MTVLELVAAFPDLYEIHRDETGRHEKEVIYWLMIEEKDGGYSRLIGSMDKWFGGIECLPDKKGKLGTIFM